MDKKDYTAVEHVAVEMNDANVKVPVKYAPFVPDNAPVTLEWNSLNVAINVSLILYI